MIGALARQLETSDGQGLSLPVASAHGAGAWTAENAATTPSDETFAQVVLNAYKATTKVIVSEELAGDAIDAFDAYLADELGRRLGLLEESAFAQGDGTNKPLGLVHASSGIGTVTAATGSSTTFTLADFRAAFAALPAGYQVNASWLMSPSPFLNKGRRDRQRGRAEDSEPPFRRAEPLLAARLHLGRTSGGAANARSVVVGDFQAGYAVRRVRGLSVKRQLELCSNTGQIGMVLFTRVDGRVVLPDALRILVHSAT